MLMKRWFYLFLGLLFLSACAGTPEGVQPVTGFQVERYLGKWYEIARLDHPFERGLEQVSAEYSLRDDGDLRVLNRGFNTNKQKFEEAEGRAKFVGQPDVGQLKVSFFGPFYGGYNVIALDSQYQYALVSGPDRGYLWILSRTPTIPESVKQEYLSIARELGFPVEKLVWVNHR